MKKENKVGEKRKMNCGLMATIIKYKNSYDIDVRFENNRIARNRQYCNFERGRILPDGYILHKEKRLKETKTMNCGLDATIIDYRSSSDIDVRFNDKEKSVLTGVQYSTFKNGALLPPGYYDKQKREKEKVTVIAQNGMKMTCTYYSANDIDVIFEDGTVVEGKRYNAFLQGKIKYPKKQKSIEERESN